MNGKSTSSDDRGEERHHCEYQVLFNTGWLHAETGAASTVVEALCRWQDLVTLRPKAILRGKRKNKIKM